LILNKFEVRPIAPAIIDKKFSSLYYTKPTILVEFLFKEEKNVAEKNYARLRKAKEKFEKAVAAAIEEYEQAGATPIASIVPKRREGKVAEIRVN